MKTIFPSRLKAFTLCAGFFSLIGCKERSLTAPDLIPDVDNIHTFEITDFAFSLHNAYKDSLQTNDYSYMVAGLGSIQNDPFFGNTNSGIFLQFVPPTENFSFPAGYTVDSAVLSLPYFSYVYGNNDSVNNLQHIKVHRITGDFKKEEGLNYYSFQSFAFDNNTLGSRSFNLSALKDTVALPTGDSLTGQLRIRLNDQLANLLVAETDNSHFASSTSFLEYFKGLCLLPDTTRIQQSIVYFRLDGPSLLSSARIDFHLHNSEDNFRLVSFPFNSNVSAFYNRIFRNYSGKPATQFINSNRIQDSIVIQSYPGFYTDITIKNIDHIPPSVINKAQLILTVLPVGADNIFQLPIQLLAEGIYEDSSTYIIADMIGGTSSELFNFFDGKPKKVTIDGNEYNQYILNIPRELEKAVAERKSELKLRISSSISYPGAFRMVAAGAGGAANTRIRFNVIYTK